MNRLEERVAEAICAGQGLSWEDQSDPMKSANGDDCRQAFIHDARSALSALESQGLKIVPVETLRKWYIELDREAHDLSDEVAAMLNAVEE